jgi:hypothetical protein
MHILVYMQWRVEVKLRDADKADEVLKRSSSYGQELLPEFPDSENHDLRVWYYAAVNDRQAAEALADHLGHHSLVEVAYTKPSPK